MEQIITINRNDLLRPLQIVQGVLDRKQILPILSCVLVQIHADNLQVTATDLEVELLVKTKLINSVSDKFTFILPGKKLYDICKSLDDDAEISLAFADKKIEVTSGCSSFSLATQDHTQYPSLENQSAEINFLIKQASLKQLLTLSQFAMAQNNVRHYLLGMLWELTEDNLILVASDGHRLAKTEAKVQHTSIDLKKKLPTRITVPRKTILELQKILDNTEEEISVSISERSLRLIAKDYCFSSKLLDVEFPDYQQIIPSRFIYTIELDKQVFRAALMRVSILCNEKNKAVRLLLTNNAMQLEAWNNNNEFAKEVLSTNCTVEGQFEICFNVSYLLDLLNVAAPGRLSMELSSAQQPTRFMTMATDMNSEYIVMPMCV